MTYRLRAGAVNGVRCPSCERANSIVLSVRKGKDYVRRRHACLTPACRLVESKYGDKVVTGLRWTTYEYFSPRPGVIAIPPDMRAVRLRKLATGGSPTTNL